MQDSFYNIPRPCFVYLLVLDIDDEEPFYYVGKSFASSMSKVYSRHIHSGFAATRNIFSVDAQPKLYILQDRPLTGDESYRYVVAYTRFFAENTLGESLNYEGTEWQSKFMKPETLKIYEEISREALVELLRRAYVPRAIDADRKRAEVEEQGNKRTTQLNVSIRQEDKVLFDLFCRRMGVNRRDAFGLLLEVSTSKTAEHYGEILGKKEREIERKSQEIKKLEQKLDLATGKALPQKELWASAMYPFMIEGVNTYLAMLFPEREVIEPILSRSYKGFARQQLPDEEYVYPEKEGFYLLRLQAILWGNHKSCFYAGVDMDGHHYRMRYYDKDWFLGIPPRGSGYEEQNSWWLCGVKMAADGAMELIAALPLPYTKACSSVQMDNQKDQLGQKRKQSLDDRIADIKCREV